METSTIVLLICLGVVFFAHREDRKNGAPPDVTMIYSLVGVVLGAIWVAWQFGDWLLAKLF